MLARWRLKRTAGAAPRGFSVPGAGSDGAVGCPEPARLALHLFGLDADGGGVAISTIQLANAFRARGHRVDLVLCRVADRSVLDQLRDDVGIVQLRPSALFPFYALAAAPIAAIRFASIYRRQRTPILLGICCLPALVGYLRRARPAAMLSAKTPSNLVALWAAKLARVPTRVVVSERTVLSAELADRNWLSLLPAIRRMYPLAAARVGVSNGVAEDGARLARMPREDFETIYSPVFHPGVLELAAARLAHPWFEADAPVILGVGRLDPQKDFATLLRAFAEIRRQRLAKLVILGEGALRADLAALARRLGIAEHLDMPGFVRNPYAYMARASVLAASSPFEGFGRVVVEALAVGCPVVSTDCPSGPAEILDGGAYGRLVPVGDWRALAKAIVAALDGAPPRGWLQRRGRQFSVDRSADRYLEVLLGAPSDRQGGGCQPAVPCEAAT